ncbi:MAG: hypothetical protein ABIQ39_02065 [Ilumatobacteraceae bacterium]
MTALVQVILLAGTLSVVGYALRTAWLDRRECCWGCTLRDTDPSCTLHAFTYDDD